MAGTNKCLLCVKICKNNNYNVISDIRFIKLLFQEEKYVVIKMADVRAMTPSKGRTQIPIVCPGHTRPLAELEFRDFSENGKDYSFLVSACHGKQQSDKQYIIIP